MTNVKRDETNGITLLPCPFCGGVPIVDCGYHYDYDGGNRYYVYSADITCSCGCTLHVENSWPKVYVADEHMLDFAIAAWNTRAERTCRNVAKNDSVDEFVCSECGHVDGAYEYGPEVGEYCKGCGAKVVDAWTH